MHDATRPTDPSPAPPAGTSWELAAQPAVASSLDPVAAASIGTPTGGPKLFWASAVSAFALTRARDRIKETARAYVKVDLIDPS